MHNAYVMSLVPKERLLIFSAKEGWDPLCKFLKKEKPDVPFPHDNKSSDLVSGNRAVGKWMETELIKNRDKTVQRLRKELK